MKKFWVEYIKKQRMRQYDTIKNTKAANFKYLNENFCKHGQTVLLGDSISEIYNTVELFEKYRETTGLKVYNRGIDGDWSAKTLERLQDNALNIEPAYLVILIGTNDVGLISNAKIADNISKILEQTREQSPSTEVILEAVYPVNYGVNPSMVGRRKNSTVKALNVDLQQIAAQLDVTWLDLTATLSDADGLLRADYCYDGLHLNAHGYEAVTEKLIPLITPA